MTALLSIMACAKSGTLKLVSEDEDIRITDRGTASRERGPDERRRMLDKVRCPQRALMAALSIVVASLIIPGISLGETFWIDDFENGLMPNWDTSACGDPVPQNGCNPAISTDEARSGAHSLRGDYRSCSENGCGTYLDRLHPDTDEIWTRFYYRTRNFTYNYVGTKWFYNADLFQPGYPMGWWGTKWGGRQVYFEGGNVDEVCPDGSGGNTTCAYPANVASIDLADDAWYCIETHVKWNTPGVADGALEAFVDGTQVMGYYGRRFRGSVPDGPNGNSSLTTFRYVRIYTQHGSGLLYYDDFAVGNTRIGCQGSVSTPTVQDAPPTTPIVRDESAATPIAPDDSAVSITLESATIPNVQDKSATTTPTRFCPPGRARRGRC